MRSHVGGRYLLALILSASAASAQPSPVVVRGRIVADDNDRPLRRAVVMLGRRCSHPASARFAPS